MRSYVLRQGRMTPSQARALTEGWGEYGLGPENGPLDAASAFGRTAPLILEIGFGNGASLLQQMLQAPHANYLGIEVYMPGIGSLIRAAKAQGVHNLKIYHGDALDVLATCIPAATVDRLQLYFPDPWPKKRHNKRRIVRADTLDVLTRVVKIGAWLHIATDWRPYAEEMAQLLGGLGSLATLGTPFVAKPAWRPETRFERRGRAFARRSFDLLYRKVTDDPGCGHS